MGGPPGYGSFRQSDGSENFIEAAFLGVEFFDVPFLGGGEFGDGAREFAVHRFALWENGGGDTAAVAGRLGRADRRPAAAGGDDRLVGTALAARRKLSAPHTV